MPVRVWIMKNNVRTGNLQVKRRTVTFGNKNNDQADIKIPSRKHPVALEHCQITLTPEKKFFLMQMGEHPTLVNGIPVKESVALNNNDVITIGNNNFQFEFDNLDGISDENNGKANDSHREEGEDEDDAVKKEEDRKKEESRKLKKEEKKKKKEAKRKAEEKAEEEAEEERKKQKEEEKKIKDEEKKRKAEEEKKIKAEEKKLKAEEKKRKAEEKEILRKENLQKESEVLSLKNDEKDNEFKEKNLDNEFKEKKSSEESKKSSDSNEEESKKKKSKSKSSSSSSSSSEDSDDSLESPKFAKKRKINENPRPRKYKKFDDEELDEYDVRLKPVIEMGLLFLGFENIDELSDDQILELLNFIYEHFEEDLALDRGRPLKSDLFFSELEAVILDE